METKRKPVHTAPRVLIALALALAGALFLGVVWDGVCQRPLWFFLQKPDWLVLGPGLALVLLVSAAVWARARRDAAGK